MSIVEGWVKFIVSPETGLDSLDNGVTGNWGPDKIRIGVVFFPTTSHPTSALHKSLGYYYLSNSFCVLPGKTHTVPVEGRFNLYLRHAQVYLKWQNFLVMPILYYCIDLFLKYNLSLPLVAMMTMILRKLIIT